MKTDICVCGAPLAAGACSVPGCVASSKVAQLAPEILAQFTGTDEWHRHGLNRKVIFTDGVKYVADVAGAYWLIDEIALAQWHPVLRSEPFQVWRLTVADHVGRLVADDGNDNKLVSREIPFTDFPLTEIKFYFSDGVILLPSEY